MPYRNNSSTPKKSKRKTTPKKKPATKKRAPKKNTSPRTVKKKVKFSGVGKKFVSLANKVFSSSISHAEELIPLVIKAAQSVGFEGQIGTGIAVLSLLSQTDIGKAAVRMFVAKTQEISPIQSLRRTITDTVRDTADFDDVARADVIVSILNELKSVAFVDPETFIPDIVTGVYNPIDIWLSEWGARIYLVDEETIATFSVASSDTLSDLEGEEQIESDEEFDLVEDSRIFNDIDAEFDELDGTWMYPICIEVDEFSIEEED